MVYLGDVWILKQPDGGDFLVARVVFGPNTYEMHGERRRTMSLPRCVKRLERDLGERISKDVKTQLTVSLRQRIMEQPKEPSLIEAPTPKLVLP